jgi:hypothetical protein
MKLLLPKQPFTLAHSIGIDLAKWSVCCTTNIGYILDGSNQIISIIIYAAAQPRQPHKPHSYSQNYSYSCLVLVGCFRSCFALQDTRSKVWFLLVTTTICSTSPEPPPPSLSLHLSVGLGRRLPVWSL